MKWRLSLFLMLCFSTKIVSRAGRAALETIFEVYCEDTLLFYGVAHSVRQRPYAAKDNARSNGCATAKFRRTCKKYRRAKQSIAFSPAISPQAFAIRQNSKAAKASAAR